MSLQIASRYWQNLVAPQACANQSCSGKAWLWTRTDRSLRINGQWYCSNNCAQLALSAALNVCPSTTGKNSASMHRLPLGLLLLSRGAIDELQLRDALFRQSRSRECKLGECLRDMGAVSDAEVVRALGAQNNLPILSAERESNIAELPVVLLQAARCVAFRGSYRHDTVYAAFAGDSDVNLLSAIGQVLGVRCEACITSEQIIRAHLSRLQANTSSRQIVFDTLVSKAEIARIILSYCQQLEAKSVRFACTRHYRWARLEGLWHWDLLFREPPQN